MPEDFDILNAVDEVVDKLDADQAQRREAFLSIAKERGNNDALWRLGTMLFMLTKGMKLEDAGIEVHEILTDTSNPD